jgi:hypothetical protein
MRGEFQPPLLTRAQNERTFALGLTTADAAAQTTFRLTRFVADYTVVSRPKIPDPAKMRVRFHVYGFGLAAREATAPAPAIYVHYLTPTPNASEPGRVRRSVRLGSALGPCGKITRSRIVRLFPFSAPKFGLWQLQFDTRRTYTQGTASSRFPWVRRGLCIQPVGAARPDARHPCPTVVRR